MSSIIREIKTMTVKHCKTIIKSRIGRRCRRRGLIQNKANKGSSLSRPRRRDIMTLNAKLAVRKQAQRPRAARIRYSDVCASQFPNLIDPQ